MVKFKLTKKEKMILYSFMWKKNYAAYPAMIERDLGGKVSRVTASKACQKLEQLGILMHEMRKAPRQRFNTEHYMIDTSRSGFLSAAKVLLSNENRECWHWVYSEVYDQILTEEFIIDLLKGKKASMNVILRYCSKDASYDEPQESPIYGWWSDDLMVTFPMLSLDEYRERSLDELIGTDVGTTSIPVDWIKNKVANHYERHQRERLVFPIFALINASHSSLEEFLFGDWEPFVRKNCTHYSEEGSEQLDHIIYRLVIRAVNELALRRDVANGRVAYSAYFGHLKDDGPGQRSMLRIIMADGTVVHYNIKFDTDKAYYGDEEGNVYPVENNPEDCWVECWVEHCSVPSYQ